MDKLTQRSRIITDSDGSSDKFLNKDGAGIIFINPDGFKGIHKFNSNLIASHFTRDLIVIKEALYFYWTINC